MTRINKLLGFLMALALAALALPADAQNTKRQYTLNITSPASLTVDGGTSNVPMTLAVANVSPDGISTIKSFQVYIPANSGITIKQNSASLQSPFTGSVSVSADGLSVTVNSLNPPAKPFDPSVGTIYLSFNVDVACSFTSVTWAANVNTGTPVGSGQPFLLKGSNPTLSRGTACSVQWNQPGVSPAQAAAMTPTPASVSCNPSTPSYGSSTTCTATLPSAGFKFSNWTGVACTNAQPSTTCITPALGQGPYTLTANFTAYNANVTQSTGGTISCGLLQNDGTITCTATPSISPAYALTAWGGDCSSTPATSSSCVLAMNGDKAVSATFTPQYNVSGTGTNGSVSCSPSTVLQGGSSTCTATANSGYFLSSFSANCPRNGTTNTCTVTNVTADTTVTGNFVQQAGAGPVDCAAPGTAGTANYASSNVSSVTPSNLDPDGFLIDLSPSGGVLPGDFAIRRAYNQDGSCGPKVGVNITFRPDIATNAAEFVYDKSLVSNGMFMYTIYWPSGVTAVDGWSSDRPLVSIDGINFVNAQKCQSDVLSLDAFPTNVDVCVASHGWIADPDDATKIFLYDTFFDKHDIVLKYP